MPTDKQITANAQNAKKSTGPRTAKGRARSSMNALKHGLSTRDFVVFERERQEFEAFLASWSETIQPSGALEEELFAQITQAAWNMRRVRRAESNLTGEKHRFFKDSQDDPITKCHKISDLIHYARYSARNERTFYRALRDLRSLQTDRALRETLVPAAQPSAAPLDAAPATPTPAQESVPAPAEQPAVPQTPSTLPPLACFVKLTKRTQWDALRLAAPPPNPGGNHALKSMETQPMG